jgi:hypothetical protein
MAQLLNDQEALTERSDSAAAPLILSDFMNALQRLFRIGVYYPSGHVILDQATDRFLALLRSLAQEKHFIRIEDDGRSLLLERIRLNDSQSFIADFRRLMASLSITAMEINRDISREDLHVFIRQMIAGRAQRANSKQFASIELADLPAAVNVTRKEFLARESSLGEGRLDAVTKNLNAFFDALASHGLTEEQIDQCRLVLASLASRMEKISGKSDSLSYGKISVKPEDLSIRNLSVKPEDLRVENKLVRSDDLPYANWDDVALLLVHAVQGKPLVSRSSSHGNLDMLASILSNLEEETQDRKSREAINLLVSIIRKPMHYEGDTGEGKPPGHLNLILAGATIAELQEFADKNRLNKAILLKIQEIPTENETLSVLMQLAQSKLSLHNQTRISQFLKDIFAAGLKDKTWDILTNGLLAIVRAGNQANLTVAIRLVTETLRCLGNAESQALFLKTMQFCLGTEENILWPYAVNELLACGTGGNIDNYRQLCVRLAHLPWKDMVQALPVLQNLDVFQRGQVAPDIFTEMSPSIYPLCAFLLRTSMAPQIGGGVVAGLKNSPADRLIKAVVPLLDLSLPEHRIFLDSYLRHPHTKEPTDGLKIMAGNIIVERLTILPQEQRGQSWIPDTIGAMAEFQGSGVRDLLNQIVTKRRMLLIPEWPSACRKAAEDASKNLRRGPRTTRKSS